MNKKGERDKAQRESLSAANTDTVMHQDLTPCLHHSFEWSILHMDTLACLCVLTNQPTALPCCIMKTFAAKIRKKRSTFLSKPQAYLSFLQTQS